jgi:hypothetical protein
LGPEVQPNLAVYQAMLPERLTDGILVRRIACQGGTIVATNVPPLRHRSQSGFDFGNDSPGASDLALACVQAVLERMDYVGPTEKVWDGSRVYVLANELQELFFCDFVAHASGDEFRIGWNQVLSWLRRMLLARVRERGLSSDELIGAWRRSSESLPDPMPETELDRADLTRQVRTELLEMLGEASILAQFLGMIG